ncbi:hypothetical protein BGX34_006829, partial [Mortierella sp. NVP85]
MVSDDWVRASSSSSSSGQRQNQPPRSPPRSSPPHQSRQQHQPNFNQARANRNQAADKKRLYYNPEKIEREIEERHKDDILKIRIHISDLNMTAPELRREMEYYGEVSDVIIDPNSALVTFESRPHNIRDLVRLNIGGRRPNLELLRNYPDSRFSAESLELGVMLAEDMFCSEFMIKSAVTIHFQEKKRQIKITFKHPFNETIMIYHVEMRFQDMDKGSIQVNSEKTEILIQLRLPPTFWRFDSKLEGSNPQKWSVTRSLRRAVDILRGGDIRGVAMLDSPVELNPTHLNAKLGR